MKAGVRNVLRRLGWLDAARALRARYGSGAVAAPMRFPTFDREVEQAAISSGDYTRYAALALAIRTLERERIDGAFAEAGVYQGATSRFLVRCAPNRRLYLFDTFEGFPAGDLESGNRHDSRFRDTSEDLVRLLVGPAANVVIRKGYFPETAAGLEGETFALVVLDLDLFAPTRAGIEFFYPRLARGAYVFAHDYTSPESNSAVLRAVSEAMAGRVERVVELPDVWGSAVFRKT